MESHGDRLAELHRFFVKHFDVIMDEGGLNELHELEGDNQTDWDNGVYEDEILPISIKSSPLFVELGVVEVLGIRLK